MSSGMVRRSFILLKLLSAPTTDAVRRILFFYYVFKLKIVWSENPVSLHDFAIDIKTIQFHYGFVGNQNPLFLYKFNFCCGTPLNVTDKMWRRQREGIPN